MELIKGPTHQYAMTVAVQLDRVRSDRGPSCPGARDGTLVMTALNDQPNVPDADGFYALLLAAHEGLDEAASHALNARLVLILANHVGDRAVLAEALTLARRSGGPQRRG